MNGHQRIAGTNRAIAALVGLFLVVGASACAKKKVGDKCKAEAEYCSPEGALFCGSDGTLKLMPCRGPKGCKASGGQVSCDTSAPVIGEGCNYPSDSYECTGDKKAVAVCKDEKWTIEATCKGVKGCQVSNDGISCDSSVADATDDCHTNGNYACTPGKDALLQCTDGKFAPVAGCRGPQGCSSREDIAAKMRNFRCDTSLGQEGDTCELAEDFTCAVDKKSVLVCRGNKWTVHTPCAGACSIDAQNNVSCNGVVAGHGGGVDHSASTGAVAKPTGGAKTGGSAAKSDAGAAPAAVDAGAKPSTVADAGAKPSGAADAGAKPAVKDAGAPKRGPLPGKH